jgi:hypothetical protein
MLLRLMPADWKKRLGIHLGASYIKWSLQQVRDFSFVPRHVLDMGAFKGNWARTCIEVFFQTRITCIEPQDERQPVLLALASQAPNLQVIQTLLGRNNLSWIPSPSEGAVWQIDPLFSCLGSPLPPQTVWRQ